ncbi:MAG TPA: hypothetical protein VGB20_02290 [bacterium]
MHRSCTSSTSKWRQAQAGAALRVLSGLVLLGGGAGPAAVWAAEREPVTLSVVAVNPSADESQIIPVKIDLPKEVTPRDILATGELKLEYDDARGAYYVFKDAVALGPKETRVFQVSLRDVWFIGQADIDSLRSYTGLLLSRLEDTEYYPTAKQLGESVYGRLDDIVAIQSDETLSRKGRIGAYRHHVQILEEIKEDLARMEKLLTFVGGPPVPEMLEESPLKSDAPSTTTTWLVIFLILIFVGLLGGQFFLTWNRRSAGSRDLAALRHSAYPGRGGVSEEPLGTPGAPPGSGRTPGS